MSHHLQVALASTLALAFASASGPAVADPVEGVEEEEVPCPEFIRGAQLRLSDAPQGTSFTITTPRPQHVNELRVALHQAAMFLERRASTIVTSDDPSAQIPPLVVAVRPVDAGIQVTVRARKTSDVGLLRRQARMLEVMWKNSSCINGESQMPPSVSA
jgi:hypothetical protein